MQNIFDKLNENMQLIYRKAIDADQAIDELQRQGKGKFATIFTDESGFQTNAKRFSPYMEELARDIVDLQSASEDEIAKALPTIVKKMELMFTTLDDFKGVIKAQ